MAVVFEFLAERPILVLFLLLGLGAALGRVRIGGVSLGAIAVLFVAMALTASAAAMGITVELPALVGELGLALFAFCVGLLAGPGFFHAIKTAYPLLLVVAAFLVAAAAAGYGLGRAMGMSATTIAGTFAGAVTNTPALAATGGSAEATVGYASAYVFGVIGVMISISLALRMGGDESDAPAPLAERAMRVDITDEPLAAEVAARHGVTFSRIRYKGGMHMEVVGGDTVLAPGAVVNVVGPADAVDAVVRELGHASTLDIVHDFSRLDYRRMVLSNPRLAGRTIASLRLHEKYGATIARVRRGDIELVGSGGVVLHQGDRLRVVGPRDAMKALTEYIGDSERGITDVNPPILGIGIAVGILVGALQIPLPGGASFGLGTAAGALAVGLILGRIGRIGRVHVSLPDAAATVLSEIGLLVFLAYAGTKAGGLIITAIASGEILELMLVGATITVIASGGVFVVARQVFHSSSARLAGLLAGAQTNPAHLAFANMRTGYDVRVALGYSIVYPAAMVVKILIAQVLVVL